MRGYNMPRQNVNYSRLPTQEEIQMVRDYQIQLQLLSGWLPLRDDRIVYELIAASLLCVSDLSSSFRIPDPLLSTDHALQFQRWKQFLERNKIPISSLSRKKETNTEAGQASAASATSGDYELDLLTFCKCLMQETRNYFTSTQPLVISLSILNALIPFFFVSRGFNSLCTSSQIYFITSAILNLIFYWACTGFLFAALEDATRRYFCAEKLSFFIRAIDIDARFKLRFQSNGPSPLMDCQSSKLLTLVKQRSFQSSPLDSSSSPQNPLSHQFNQEQQMEQGLSCSARPQSSFEISSSSSPITNQLLSPSLSSPPSSSSKSNECLPVLKLADYPDNVIVWMYARKLLHNFGARIRFRLDTYCGQFR
jgi:hypothetical protein